MLLGYFGESVRGTYVSRNVLRESWQANKRLWAGIDVLLELEL